MGRLEKKNSLQNECGYFQLPGFDFIVWLYSTVQ